MSLSLIVTKTMMNKYDYPPLQLNYDACFFYGLLLVPYYVYEVRVGGEFDTGDLLTSALGFMLANLGNIFITYGIKLG